MKQRGSVIVESAISLIVLLTFLFTAMDIVRVALHAVSLQYAVSTGARWAVLGQLLPNPQNPNQLLNHTLSVEEKIRSTAASLKVTSINVQICPSYQPNCTVNNAGNPGDLISIRATRRVSLLFGGASYTVNALAFVKNEPFA